MLFRSPSTQLETSKLGYVTVLERWGWVEGHKLKQCGVAVLDSPGEILPIALHYLGLPPNSSNPADYKKAEALLLKVRPYIRYFDSSKIQADLSNGDICLAVAWSGTVLSAKQAARDGAPQADDPDDHHQLREAESGHGPARIFPPGLHHVVSPICKLSAVWPASG